MSDMFCFQCQQTAGNKCCLHSGVCGKKPETARSQDELIYELIRLSDAVLERGKRTVETDRLIIDGLFVTLTNVNFDNAAIEEYTARAATLRREIAEDIPVEVPSLFNGNTDIVSLRSTLLFGLKGMAAYAHHCMALGFYDENVIKWFYKGLSKCAREHSVEKWLELILEFGMINLRCMECLDIAHTKTFGIPSPAAVNTDIKKGPFIVISGHDLLDLKQLLEQTEGKGINIYTHGEMLPAHGYPELRKYKHLAGNFGTAWQNQQHEFKDLPAPVLFTTNCIMPPLNNYKDRIYTTSVVGYDGLTHIETDANGKKDFTPLIEHSLRLGGFEKDMCMCGINGGHILHTGYAHDTVLRHAAAVINSIKSGAVKRIFLVGGCDGAHPGRNYYTEFVKSLPMDTIILTLACGKYRFNDIDLGDISGLPRIMDIGQCNDAYSAIKIASELAEALNCSVNDLPLTLVLSWYEQKAVCILLSLLALGIKNIYLGPTLPAFLSENVVKLLSDTYGLKPITTPERDIADILSQV